MKSESPFLLSVPFLSRRSVFPAVLFFLLLAAAWALFPRTAAGQSRAGRKGGRGRVDCRACGDTGLVPCEDHAAAIDFCKKYSFFCSECERTLPCCRGRGLRPCDCVDRDWENLVEDPGYEVFHGFIDGRKELVDYMKARPLYAMTEHFFIMSTLEGIKLSPGEVAKRSGEFGELKRSFPRLFQSCQNLSPHAMLHLYALRLEAVYAAYCAALGMTVEEDRQVGYSSGRVEVFLAGSNKEHAAWTARHGGASLVSGASGMYCLSQKGGAKGGRHMKSYGPALSGDENFHDGVIHLASRCLLERFFCARGGKFPPGWLKVGFPHWMEWTMLGQCSYYLVNVEVKGLGEEWISGDWDKRAVSLAGRAQGSVTSFALLSKKDFADMGFREHVLSFSYVDLLMSEDHGKFRKYCDDLRRRMTPRDALMDAYGWSELTLETKWRSRLLMAEDDTADLGPAERFVVEFDRSRNLADLETRASAAYYLKYCDDLEAAKRILAAFQDGDVLVRSSALEALKTFDNEEAVDYVVANGLGHSSADVRRNTAVALGAFPGIMKKTVPLLVGLLEDKKAAVRAGAVRALGELHPGEAYMPLAARADDKNPEVRVETALALCNYHRDEALTQVIKLLRDPVWAVRLAAIRAMANIRDKRMIPALIDQLGREGGRLREDILDLLAKLTHQDFGLGVDRWKWWWNNYGGKFEFTSGPSQSQVHKMRYAVQYHDVNTCSKKFIFLLDTSSSMNEIVTVQKEAGRTYGKGDLRKKKINVAQTELVRLLRTFDKNIYFDIITFADGVGKWKKTVVSARKDTVRQAEKFVWNIKPPQKAATDVYDALMAAFDMVDAAFAKRKYDSVVDTMFFLSDGNPTAGAVTDVDMILQAVRERNRIYAIKIHTFALGGRSGDTYFLRKLAEQSGGQFKVIRVR